MLFTVKIINNERTSVFKTIDIGSVDIFDSSVLSENDIWEYNDLFSKIIYDHKDYLKYLISPTLTRIEGQTFFYESVCRLIYSLFVSSDTEDNILFINVNHSLLMAMISQFQKSGKKFYYNKYKVVLFSAISWIRFTLRALKFLCDRSLYVLISRIFLKAPDRSCLYDYAFKTFYDYRSIVGGTCRDQYFDPLIMDLVKKQKRIIIFNRVLHYNKPGLFIKYVSSIARTSCGYENTVIDSFLNFSDIFKSFVSGFIKRPGIDRMIIFKGRDITNLAKYFLMDDFKKMRWFDTWLEYYFAKKLFKNFAIERLIYPYENHPWEKSYVFARNELKSPVRLIAYQHSSISYKVTQHFPGKFEQDINIFPDKILTVGKMIKNIMEEKGHYPPGLLEEGCALRYPALFKEPGLSLPGKKKKIAYAFSFDMKNYERVLKFLTDIFDGTEYTLYLKFHPVYIKLINKDKELSPNLFDARDIPWGKLLEDIDILLYDDTSVGIEALRYNLDVGYFALAEQVYNTDRLFAYKGDKIIVNSVREFKLYLDKYYKEDKIVGDGIKEANKNYLREYFIPVTEERLGKFS